MIDYRPLDPNWLRQRDPFLFAKGFLPLDPEDPAAGIAATFTFTGDEPYFAGHFPGEPVVPGVLLIEAMAQAARVALAYRDGHPSPGFLAAVERTRFNHRLTPPADLRITARLNGDGAESDFVRAQCAVFQGRTRACRADLALSLSR
jgi:3-hydroxyacyl-[acyl-carrier-protein] dehydratase